MPLSSITKLTEQANRVKSAMDKAEKVVPVASQRVDDFLTALDTFETHGKDFAKRTTELNAAMAGLGNAAVAMDDAFRDDTKATDAPKPPEAGLPKAPQLNASQGTVGAQGGSAQSQPFPGNKV